MNLTDLKRILKLLGPAGTAAGLRVSDISIETLRDLATKVNQKASKLAGRDELIEILISLPRKAPLKPTSELMTMNYDELVHYFNDVAPSSEDLLKVMKELDYKVSAEDKKHLRRFVARQISETALFSRVASRSEDNRRK